MRDLGDSMQEIALALDLSMDLVRRISRTFETETVLADRSRQYLENIRKADDPNKKWKVNYVIQALRPKNITANALIHHFEWSGVPAVTLRELMDLAIPQKNHPKAGYLITPLLDVRCVGVEGFWSVVHCLTESDLGEKCNEEWRKRLARLRQSSRIVGAQRTWSKPCRLPSWLSRPEKQQPWQIHQ